MKTSKRNPVFNMIWLMEILKIYLEEKLLINYYVITITITNQELAKELQKPFIRKFGNEKYNHLLKAIFGVLADMQITSKYDKGFRILLCVIDIFSK